MFIISKTKSFSSQNTWLDNTIQVLELFRVETLCTNNTVHSPITTFKSIQIYIIAGIFDGLITLALNKSVFTSLVLWYNQTSCLLPKTSLKPSVNPPLLLLFVPINLLLILLMKTLIFSAFPLHLIQPWLILAILFFFILLLKNLMSLSDIIVYCPWLVHGISLKWEKGLRIKADLLNL